MAGIIILRNVDEVDPGDGSPTYLMPQVPAAFDVMREGDTGWYTIRQGHPGKFLHAYLVIDGRDIVPAVPGKAVFILASPVAAVRSWLRSLADGSSNAWTPKELRNDNGVVATRIKNAWPDDRQRWPAGHPDAGQLVNPAEHVVGLRRTVAGFMLHTDCELVETVAELPTE